MEQNKLIVLAVLNAGILKQTEPWCVHLHIIIQNAFPAYSCLIEVLVSYQSPTALNIPQKGHWDCFLDSFARYKEKKNLQKTIHSSPGFLLCEEETMTEKAFCGANAHFKCHPLLFSPCSESSQETKGSQKDAWKWKWIYKWECGEKCGLALTFKTEVIALCAKTLIWIWFKLKLQSHFLYKSLVEDETINGRYNLWFFSPARKSHLWT